MSNEISITIEENIHLLELETQINNHINNIDIDISSRDIIEISTDFIANTIFVSDIIGLDSYLSNFIDSYNIDCGSP